MLQRNQLRTRFFTTSLLSGLHGTPFQIVNGIPTQGVTQKLEVRSRLPVLSHSGAEKGLAEALTI